MRLHLPRRLLFTALLCFAAGSLHAAPTTSEKMERLEADLLRLKSDAELGRIISGLSATGIGVASLAAAGFMAVSPGLRNDYGLELLPLILGIPGAVWTAVGIPILLIPTEAETAYADYHPLGFSDDSLAAAKVAHGENSLRRLAESGFWSRAIGAGVGVATGVGYLVAFVQNGVTTAFGNDSYLYSAVASLLTGLAAAAFPSPAETAWEDYKTFAGISE